MKKIYLKPDAEYVSFYSDDEIMAKQTLGSIQYYATEDDSSDGVTGNLSGVGGGVGEGPGYDGME